LGASLGAAAKKVSFVAKSSFLSEIPNSLLTVKSFPLQRAVKKVSLAQIFSFQSKKSDK
jgi:hypothetical protein